jgi:hypothetical protein
VSIGGRKHRIGERKHRIGERKHRIGGRKHRIGERKHRIGERKHRIGERKHHSFRQSAWHSFRRSSSHSVRRHLGDYNRAKGSLLRIKAFTPSDEHIVEIGWKFNRGINRSERFEVQQSVAHLFSNQDRKKFLGEVGRW